MTGTISNEGKVKPVIQPLECAIVRMRSGHAWFGTCLNPVPCSLNLLRLCYLIRPSPPNQRAKVRSFILFSCSEVNVDDFHSLNCKPKSCFSQRQPTPFLVESPLRRDSWIYSNSERQNTSLSSKEIGHVKSKPLIIATENISICLCDGSVPYTFSAIVLIQHQLVKPVHFLVLPWGDFG